MTLLCCVVLLVINNDNKYLPKEGAVTALARVKVRYFSPNDLPQGLLALQTECYCSDQQEKRVTFNLKAELTAHRLPELRHGDLT